MLYQVNGIKEFLIDSCLYGSLYTGVGTTTMLLAEIILMMRVYALFGGAGKTLLSLITLTLLLFGFNIVQLLFDLVVKYPFSSNQEMFTDAYLPSTVQVKKLKLPARISRLESGQTKTQDITTLMAKDSIAYFAV
ncbi:uncharacterized protein FOMMEDRAFT_27217 [Fomitiporia mediterranea MF3/22]|uniref:uncharacterized protein n=1 Tax=Fomitiporia mediterranea (strain MF3/22) TaxID=694068 RepID=UPI0004407F8F|nr:uncharacterized protein FOMMEDRAFT_27217 [Fomitiporia mediterranea MF3/22]EJD04938.1 hypothetical protein FOMMEDRAFT_27217 [Fomitiporia mediterranea MF3/22]